MSMTRRKFLSLPPKALAAAMLSGSLGFGAGFGCSGTGDDDSDASRPNFLFLLVDQFRTPPVGYGTDEGEVDDLKEIFGFREISPGNFYTGHFPALMRLRQHAVVLQAHYTASAACTPSRACIFTGQYTTGVEQTDGMFKSADHVPWLDPEGAPTIGDWFRAVGYTTHYFGKWHVSDPEDPDYLDPWGFADWESSYPEPHGSNPYNLGVYRDVEFADAVEDFLTKKGNSNSGSPWFAVGSLVNPHDVCAWPSSWHLPQDLGVVPWIPFPPPPPIPGPGDESLPNPDGLRVELNPDGFPQDCCFLPPTYNESLDEKPRCQYDYSLKWGMALKSKMVIPSPLPFQLQGAEAEAWSLAYNQFYTYGHYLADRQLHRILQALDDHGLTDNTIVVFLSDHGELGGAHGGMIQKWHNAYEESIRVPMVISSPLVNGSPTEIRYITQPTSSIDIAPTLLGLAGYNIKKLTRAVASLQKQLTVDDFVGTDLSPYIKNEAGGDIPGPDGLPRPGVFFMTNDTILALPADADLEDQEHYAIFLDSVEATRLMGYHLESGSVPQPNCVRALCTGDWKIVRYVDPNGVEANEWELYHLVTDPTESTNIVNFATGEVRNDVTVAGWTTAELISMNDRLKVQLAEQQALMLHQVG
jgi:arylsulfatase A-like enzyme